MMALKQRVKECVLLFECRLGLCCILPAVRELVRIILTARHLPNHVEEKIMKGRIVLVWFVLAALSVITVAQAPSQMPQPGPEQKRLQYYGGTWTAEYEMKAGAMGPGGKMTSTDHTQMLPGGFFAVSHTDGKGSMGELHGVAIMGYDSEGRVYRHDSYNKFGEPEHFKGTVQGETWT